MSDISNAKYQIYKTRSQNVQPPVVYSTLQIKEQIKVDIAIFECVARNKFGSDRAEYRIKLKVPVHYNTLWKKLFFARYNNFERSFKLRWCHAQDLSWITNSSDHGNC